jgi:hypothetical protein
MMTNDGPEVFGTAIAEIVAATGLSEGNYSADWDEKLGEGGASLHHGDRTVHLVAVLGGAQTLYHRSEPGRIGKLYMEKDEAVAYLRGTAGQ